MRRLLLACVLLFSSCAEKPVQAPEPDVPHFYGLPMEIHDHDFICMGDKYAPTLRSCMRIDVFKGLMNSVRAN